jgi:UDPglucose 6-dehydrogenase
MKMKIGILGYGVLGKSIHNMMDNHEVKIQDPFKNMFADMASTQAVFVCVPTPTIRGKQDISIVEEVIRDLDSIMYIGLIIIKSTVLPTNARMLLEKYTSVDIMFAPEFLNQHEPYFIHPKHLIGITEISHAKFYREIFDLAGYGHHEVRTTDPITACLIKYAHNVHGAMKVTFFHELNDICTWLGVNYREMLGGLLTATDHIDANYTKIAADGKLGYGGCCYPKDAVAYANELDSGLIACVCEINRKYRKDEMSVVE